MSSFRHSASKSLGSTFRNSLARARSLMGLSAQPCSLLFWMLVLRAILSWVSQGRSPVDHVLLQLTEPLLAPIRRIIPPMGGLDLSVLVLFLILQAVNIFLSTTGWIAPIWNQL